MAYGIYPVWVVPVPNKRSSPNDCDLYIRQKLIGAKLEPPIFFCLVQCNARFGKQDGCEPSVASWKSQQHKRLKHVAKKMIHPRKLHMNHCQERRFGIHIIFPCHLRNFKKQVLPPSNNKLYFYSILEQPNPILSYAQSMSLSQLATSMRKVGCPHQLPAARSFFTSTASTWT